MRSDMQPGGAQPIKIAILAMGGEGGGVLADWIVDLGEVNGFIAQTTSVPGVAQRTGATIYYVELFPRVVAERDGGEPILALMPLPGDVDVVLASELMEAGRALQRGLVTPDRTTLVASTHRVYSITEKIALGDGRVDSDNLRAHGLDAAKRFVHFDMAKVAEDTGSVISAVLFGALAGTGVLPFGRSEFEATIERGGVGVRTSLAAFEVGFERAASGFTDELPAVEVARAPAFPVAQTPDVNALLQQVRDFPQTVQPIAIEGVRRLIDYQDVDYARLYVERLTRVRRAARAAEDVLLAEVARHLALWMSYEDTVRVADLKTRDSRFDRVKAEVRAASEQLVEINEYMHPRLQEICETLPAGLGRWLERSGAPRRFVERFTTKGRVIDTTSLRGFLLLWLLAGMKRWRRSSLRYALETRRIDRWLERIEAAASGNPLLATEIAKAQRLVKGYSETHERGLRNYETIMAALDAAIPPLAPVVLRELCDAALADDRGDLLRATLARYAPLKEAA